MATTCAHGGRYVRSNDKRQLLRKDNPMFSYHIAQVIHQERQSEIEQRLRHRAAIRDEATRFHSRSIRQRIGRRVMQLGYAIAADGARAAQVTRDPCGAVGELAARR